MTDQELFCKLIRAAMFPAKYPMPVLRREQYAALRETLNSHALTQLPGELLRAESMPQPLREQWQKEACVQKLRFGQYLLRQDAILRMFSQAGIPCVVIKGTVSASYYPEPAYRAMGDLDFLIQPDDAEQAVALLKANGFREYGYRDAEEQGFIKGSVPLELHTGACPHERYSGAINAFLRSHFGENQSRELYGYAFPCMSEVCNGLILLEHMHHHLRDTLGFRQVIDWMMYVDRYLDDAAWNGGMAGLFAQFGLERFAAAVTAMCQRRFGLRTEGISWPCQADGALCDRLFEHIFAMGNFGQRLEANQKSVAAVLRDRSLWQVVKSLPRVGAANWPLCRSHPWLKPFAGIYQAGLYLYRLVHERYNLSVALVIRERRRVRRTLALMDELGLP